MFQHFEHRFGAVHLGADALPLGQEAGVGDLVDRFDPVPQPGQGATLDQRQIALVTVLLAAVGVGQEGAGGHRAFLDQLLQSGAHPTGAQPVALGDGIGVERAVGPCPPLHQVGHRPGSGGLLIGGGPRWQRNPQPVPQPGQILGDGQPAVSGDHHLGHSALADQRVDGRPGVELGCHPLPQLLDAERAGSAEQVVQLLAAPGPAILAQALQVGLDLGDHFGVQQLLQAVLAEQLGQQSGVQGQRSRLLLRERHVALVDELPDIAEQQRFGERRRFLGLDLDDADLPGRNVALQGEQGTEIEDIGQALPHRLQHDREFGIARGHRQQLGRLHPLLPQRRSGSGVAPRQQQGPGRTLAEAGGEERRAADLLGDDLLQRVGVVHDQLRTRRL